MLKETFILTIREVQIKTMMSYHYTSIKMTKIKKILTVPNAGENEKNWVIYTFQWEYKIV